MAAATRTTGLIVAVVLLVVFAGVVTFFVVRAPATGGTQTGLTGPAPTPDPNLVPAKGPDGEGTPSNRVGPGQGFYIQVVDKDDPTAVRAELSAERSRPIEGQTYRVALEKPVVWVFLKDGRTIYARADQGTAYIPDQSKGMGARPTMPQDGVMEGNVVAKIFEAREGDLRPNPDEDEPIGTIRTPLFRFDAELSQVELPRDVAIDAEGVQFRGSGVTIVFNEPQQRLELLHIAHTEKFEVNLAALEQQQERRERKKEQAPAASREIASKPIPANGSKPGPSAPEKKPAETLYRLVCTDGVTVTHGTRTISSEQLEAWGRLVGNQLRPGAVMMSNAGPRKAEAAGGDAGKKPATGTTTTAAKGAKPAAQPAAGESLLTGDPDTPVILTWKGPLELRPLTAKTAELDFNDIFVRFTSKAATGVAFRDSKAKARADGNMLEYGATRREVALAGVGPQGAKIAMEGAGNAAAERFDMSLVTGLARVGGPGLLAGVEKAGKAAQTFAWKNEGQFQFGKDAKGEVTEQLTKVTASGATRATDGSGSLSGETMVAGFVPVDAKRSRLDTLTVVGRAHAEGENGALDADKLDVAFVAMAGRPEESDPRTVVAQGRVKGQRKDKGKTSTMDASWLEATLGRVNDSAGKPTLTATDIKAKDMVFARSDGLKARAPQLRADPVAGIARLTGTGNSVSVGNTDSTMTGQDMTFYDAERRLVAAGPGTLTHDAKESGGKPAAKLVASWTREMTFDDVQGLVTCKGDAAAELSKSRAGVLLERDTMNAEDVVLWLTAGSASGARAQDGAADPQGVDRKLLRAVITGTLDSTAGGKPATVESRLYAANTKPNEQPVMERLMYLKSARIGVDDEKGALEVPKAGTLLFVDRRAAEKAGAGGAEKLLDNPENARGTAMFTWAGSMNFARPTGVVTLREAVHLDHLRPGDAQKSELECETLVARVREEAGGGGPDSFRGELLSADAEGAVWMRYAGRELVADKAQYDAVKRVLHAQAMGENKVQVFGGAGAAGDAKEVVWDLAKDTVEIVKPGTVTTPRR